MPSVSEIAERHWQWIDRMGWHNTTPLEKLALITSKIGEAVDECRGEKCTDKYPIELADIILRALDAMWDAGYDPNTILATKMTMNELRGNKGRLK